MGEFASARDDFRFAKTPSSTRCRRRNHEPKRPAIFTRRSAGGLLASWAPQVSASIVDVSALSPLLASVTVTVTRGFPSRSVFLAHTISSESPVESRTNCSWQEVLEGRCPARSLHEIYLKSGSA